MKSALNSRSEAATFSHTPSSRSLANKLAHGLVLASSSVVLEHLLNGALPGRSHVGADGNQARVVRLVHVSVSSDDSGAANHRRSVVASVRYASVAAIAIARAVGRAEYKAGAALGGPHDYSLMIVEGRPDVDSAIHSRSVRVRAHVSDSSEDLRDQHDQE